MKNLKTRLSAKETGLRVLTGPPPPGVTIQSLARDDIFKAPEHPDVVAFANSLEGMRTYVDIVNKASAGIPSASFAARCFSATHRLDPASSLAPELQTPGNYRSNRRAHASRVAQAMAKRHESEKNLQTQGVQGTLSGVGGGTGGGASSNSSTSTKGGRKPSSSSQPNSGGSFDHQSPFLPPPSPINSSVPLTPKISGATNAHLLAQASPRGKKLPPLVVNHQVSRHHYAGPSQPLHQQRAFTAPIGAKRGASTPSGHQNRPSTAASTRTASKQHAFSALRPGPPPVRGFTITATDREWAKAFRETTRFSDDELMYLFYLLRTMDVHPGDKINLYEFKDLLNLLDVDDSTLLDRMFSMFEIDRTRLMNVSSLIQALSLLLKGSQQEQIDFCFEVYDLNGNGVISRTEMMTLLEEALSYAVLAEADQAASTKALVNVVLDKFDLDLDGRIDRHEYAKVVLKNPLLLEAFGKVLPSIAAFEAGLVAFLELNDLPLPANLQRKRQQAIRRAHRRSTLGRKLAKRGGVEPRMASMDEAVLYGVGGSASYAVRAIVGRSAGNSPRTPRSNKSSPRTPRDGWMNQALGSFGTSRRPSLHLMP